MGAKAEGAAGTPYDRFARFYNRHLGNFSERLFPVIDRIVLQRIPERAGILDLCCGTGQLAALLSREGYSVVGIDESAGMIQLARENSPGSTFIQDDASTFELSGPVDAAVCTFDSINHVLSLDKLERVFARVNEALRASGYFLFDANMEDGYRSRWRGHWQGSFEGLDYGIRAEYENENRLGRNEIRVKDSAGEAVEWTIRERCYAEKEILNALGNAGFQIVSSYDAHSDLGLIGEWGRRVFVCRKAGSVNREESRSRGSVELRCVEQCRRDGVSPRPEQRRELGPESLRMDAVDCVLRRLPSEVYGSLKEQSEAFSWFIPAAEILGQIHPFTANYRPDSQPRDASYSRVIYLSPLLEQQDWPVVVVAVAHELAHVILEHEVLNPSSELYRKQEVEVDGVLSDWGFGGEVAAAKTDLSIDSLFRA